MCASEFQGPAPAGTSAAGCQALHATVEVAGVCLKTKTQKFSQAQRFCVLAWIFSPGSAPAPASHSCVCFAQRLICKYRGVREGTQLRFQSPLHLEDSSVCKCFLCML